MKPRTARSFKKELIYSFLAIAFFSIAFLGTFQIYQLSSLNNENQKSQAQTTKYLADNISNYVLEHKKAIQTGALNVQKRLENHDIAGIHKQLKDIKVNYDGFVNLYVGNLEGEALSFYPEVHPNGQSVEKLNFSDRPYFKELLKTQNTVISPVFHGRGGTETLLVTIATPIFNNQGKIMGYMLGALDLNALSEHIENRQLGEEGYTVLIDKDKNVIVHPHVNTRKELVNLSDYEIVRYIEQQESNEGIRFFKLKDPNENLYITYEKISSLDWIVWVAKPASVITDTYKNAILTILGFLCLTTVLMVGMSFFLTNRLEKTIRHLLRYIKDYTKDFKEKPATKKVIQGPKEMEELFFYFNHMIDEIEKNRTGLIKLNKELEDRVQERTANLEHKNLELKAVNKLITSVSSKKDLAHFIQHCLKEIEPFIDYSIHVFFHDIAVTNTTIYKKQNLLDYINTNMKGTQQYIEPFQIEKDHKGFLIIDLSSDQTIKPIDPEFLHTFANSLAVMLQNKFLFEVIRNKHAVLSAVLESMSEGLMLLNNQREVEYVNEFFLNVIENGEEHEILNLKDVYKQFHTLFDVDREELSAFFADEEGELKLEYSQKSRKQKHYILHKFTVMLDDDVIGEGLLLRDITKEEEIDTLKDNLISLTSHEFKTPITNIKGSVETLLRSEVDWEPEFQQALLEGVHEDIDRILHLVNDWMDISKIKSGTMFVDINAVRADYVIRKSMEQIPSALRDDAILRFHNKLDKDFVFYADKMRVQQVLDNLITNALRYNDSLIKEVNIILDKENDYVTISVMDNGIGISKEHLEKIFNRFYQVDLTATRRMGGTGLGLAICYGIMGAHQGKIEVMSTPGKGSTFKLFFPEWKGSE